MSGFSELIAPMSQEEFFAQIWGKKCFLFKRGTAFAEEILDWDFFSNLLQPQEQHFSSSISLLDKGHFAQSPAPLAILAQTSGLERLEALCDNRISIRFNDIHRHPGLFQNLSINLQAELKEVIGLNAYFSPAGCTDGALTPHADNDDIFILHLAGSKEWFTGKNGEESWQLEIGDVLYIPKGCKHRVQNSSGQNAMHIAMAIATKDASLFIEWFCKHALKQMQDVTKERSGDFYNPEERKKEIDKTITYLQTLLDDPALYKQFLKEHFIAEQTNISKQVVAS